VVGGVVYSVHTNSVDAQLLELFDIALAAVGVGDGVLSVRGAAGLVVNTANVEALVTGPESWSLALAEVGPVSEQLTHTVALDGDLGHAAGAGASGSGLEVGRGGGGGGEGGRSGGDSNSVPHGGCVGNWVVESRIGGSKKKLPVSGNGRKWRVERVSVSVGIRRD
jgi:hypothetical protein